MARHDRQFWQRAAREIERGGKVTVVAKRLGVRARTLSWWCWRLRREDRKEKQQIRGPKARFLPVVVPEPVASVAPAEVIELETGNVRLRIHVGIDTHYVVALVHALRNAC